LNVLPRFVGRDGPAYTATVTAATVVRPATPAAKARIGRAAACSRTTAPIRKNVTVMPSR
jgi:hypothetical protein